MKIRKKVVIVTSGSWGYMTPGDYSDFVSLLKTDCERANQEGSFVQFDLHLVDDYEKGLNLFNAGESGTLVFISRGIEHIAEQVAQECKGIRVVVFTGLVPPGKVTWVRKQDLSHTKAHLFY